MQVAEGCDKVAGTNWNKDHQRMMVDPMLMIVLDLKSFLTAHSETDIKRVEMDLISFFDLNK